MQSALKQVFSQLMKCDPKLIKQQIDVLVDRLSKRATGAKLNTNQPDIDSLVLRLNTQFPGDVGVFCPYLLNCLKLQPGQAIFLAANEPHAYLSGDCVECMACSDNVVRAGLTPKYRDTEELCQMLTYQANKPKVLCGEQIDKYTRSYTVPITEFHLFTTTLPNNTTYKMNRVESTSIALIYEGKGSIRWCNCTSQCSSQCTSHWSTLRVAQGTVLLICSGMSVDFQSDNNSELLIYRCSTRSN